MATAPALSPAEQAVIDRFDAAPVPPEVLVAGEGVERLAESFINEGFGWMQMDDLRRLAAAAIAALPPSPAEEAVKRVEALAGALNLAAERSFNRQHQTEGTYDEGASDALYTAARRLRAALDPS